MSYNKLTALQDNVEAIKIAWNVVSNGRNATAEERDALMKYSGFGGIKEVLYLDAYIKCFNESVDVNERTDFFCDCVRKGAEHFDYHLAGLAMQIASMCEYKDKGGAPTIDFNKMQQIADSIKNSVLTAFYTPKEVVNAVGDAVQHTLDVFGIKAESMLETSAGIGGFLPICQSASKKIAFEKDYVSSLVCAALNPDVDVYNECFETIGEHDDTNIKYDVVASNIPFGDVKVFDKTWLSQNDDVHRQAQSKLHTYFFVKGLEQLEDGGILAFVTSRGVADTEGNKYLRQWLVDNGNLLAAVRLPDNLFMDGSGIEVGSDLIIFQRDCHKSWQTLEEDFFVESIMKRLGDQTVGPVNRLLGIQSKALYTQWRVDKDRFGEKLVAKYYWRDGMDRLQTELTTMLCRDMERNFHKSAWRWGHMKVKGSELKVNGSSKSGKNGGDKKMTKAERDAKIGQMREPYNELMKCFNELMSNERVNRMEFKEQREELNRLYDLFVEKFGTLHSNEELIKTFSEYQLALSLESRNIDKTYSKADVFNHPVAFRIVDESTVFTPMEALAMSLNERGGVDMPYIEHLTRMDEQHVYEALKGEIFWMPSAKHPGLDYQHKSEAINGDVISKAKLCSERLNGACGQSELMLRDSILALQSATPTPIPYDDIDIQLGVRWLNTSYFERFAKHIFNCSECRITYTGANDMFLIDYRPNWNNDEGGTFGKYAVRCPGNNKRIAGHEIFGYALLDKCPQITYKIGEHTFTDHEGMLAVQKMIDKIRKEFITFMKSSRISVSERVAIQQIYNEKFNCYVRAQFDGAMQSFPGLDLYGLGFADLYQSQKDAIWMLKQNNGGVCWHTVGGGKTMIMCVTAYEMHRLGMCNKPIIIGLKANVAQIADTFRKAYPNGRLLYPGPDDFTKANRVEVFNKIANNDWDCIIMTHDQFGRIPLTPEVEDDLMWDEIYEIDAALDTMKQNNVGYNVSRQVQRGLEKRKENLKAKINERKAKLAVKADDVLNFRQLGIDFILVDEYQQFKNLAFTTRHGRVAGLGNAQGSSRATHLLTCIRDIQKQKGCDMCAAFFSGTIITNALTELYVLFKYLRPNELARQGITCFDAWAANYIHKSSELEIDLCNNIKEKERFRTYLNVPELTQFLRQITDYRTADMINLDLPRRKDIQDIAEPTAEQKMMLERLSKFAERGEWDVLGLPDTLKSANLDKSLMLVATNLARKIALDPRLLDQDIFHDDPNNKAHRCAKNIYENYMEYNAQKGTQFVFTDLSSYDPKKWNVSAEIRDILVREYNIPTSEITFINLYESDTAKKKLFEKLNNGEIRVIFGSTQKLGTGVNAQQRAVAVHHLDAPWRPADLEQRDGRAVRHGNEVKMWGGNEVKIYTYGTKFTLDGYKFALLQAKATFIHQLNTLGTVSRHLDEDSVNEVDGMSYAEFKALLSGNEDLIEVAKLEKKVKALEMERDRYDNQHRTAEAAIKKSEGNIERLNKEIAESDKEIEYVSSHTGDSKVAQYIDFDDDKNSVIPASIITLTDTKSQRVEDLGRVLKEVYFSKPSEPTVIGQYCGMEIVAFAQNEATVFAVHTTGNIYRRCTEKGSVMSSFVTSLTYFDNLIPQIRSIGNGLKSSLSFEESTMKANKMLLSQQWDGATELMRLQKELTGIQERLSADLLEKEKKREEQLIKEAKEK